MMSPGAELDRLVAQSLYGEWRDPIPEFSTRDVAADYLIRFLKRSRVQAAIEIDRQQGNWRCRLSDATGLIAAGEGETRPLAIALAVLTANFNPDRKTRPAPARREWARTSGRTIPRCAVCGVELASSKGPADRPRHCNLCSWERGREKILEGSRARRVRR
jgi:hypothetical protein